MIPVVLVTGFLGSGKTTFLKRQAARYRTRRVVYLVNDFAAVDVDGELVRRMGAQVVPISGGSIFCRCLVTDFIRVLRSLAHGEIGGGPPTGVVIEASGMADPRVVHKMLQETQLDQVFTLRRILAVIDPGTFHKLCRTLPNIKAQVACADTLLVSKVDRYDAAALVAVRAEAMAIQPAAAWVEMRHGEAECDIWDPAPLPATTGELAPCVDPNFHRFVVRDPIEGLEDFERRVALSGEGLYRAKGFLHAGERCYAVDASSSGIQHEECTGHPLPAPRLVCIVQGDRGAEIERIWNAAAG